MQLNVNYFVFLVQASLGANTFAVVGQAETKCKYRKNIIVKLLIREKIM